MSYFLRLMKQSLKVPSESWVDKVKTLNWLPEDSKTLCDSLFSYIGRFETVCFSWPRRGVFPREQTTFNSTRTTSSSSPFSSARGFWIHLYQS